MADRQRPLRPRAGGAAGRRKRRVVIDSQAARPRQDARTPREPKPREVQPAPPPPTGPVTVNSGANIREVSAAFGEPVPNIERLWGRLQEANASLSPEGRVVVAEQSHHRIAEDQPEVVVDAIREVVTAARAG